MIRGTAWLMMTMLTAACCVAQESGVAEPTSGEMVEAVLLSDAKPAPLADSSVVWLPPAVIAFGDVDDQLALRAQEWTATNLAISIPLLEPVPTAQLGTLDEAAQLAASMLETNRLGLVVLWRPNSNASNHGAHYPNLRVSVVNLNPMLTPDTEAEKIERRVERQVVRGVCFLFGLEPSPNPYSAMYSYSNLEELDQIGRNLDPPWLKKLQEKAVTLGIPIETENSFNMIR